MRNARYSEPRLTVEIDLIRLYLNDQRALVVLVSPWIGALLLGLVLVAWWWKRRTVKRYKLESLDINLGGIGTASLRPTLGDIQVSRDYSPNCEGKETIDGADQRFTCKPLCG